MLNKLLAEYKGSLKKLEVEEVLDLIFYRPLAFLLVKIIFRTGITPNQITLGAILFAIAGGIIFAQGGKENFFIGALFFMAYNIFDCADGQLARLKKNGSSLGRIIDGFADYIAGISAYLAIGFGFANHSTDPDFYWTLTLLAAGTNIVHAITLDYYRNRYLDYALNRNGTLDADLKQHYDSYNEISKKKGFYFQKLLYKIYFGYSKIQLLFVSKSSDKKIRKYDREAFLKYNKKMIWFWTFIGPTTEWTLFIGAALFNSIDFFFWGMIMFANAVAFALVAGQVFVNFLTTIDD
ncbi:MAG: CDP-alcohol phosphatidyltransferase family protein [Chlorobi bacterium]|nr:CDP-alcohol phosphatidyltransferase family protein [Chlorobiota bacterium]